MAAPAPQAPAPAAPAAGSPGGAPALAPINYSAGVVTNPINPTGGLLGNAFQAAGQYPLMQQQAEAAKIKQQQQAQSFAQQQIDMMSQLVASNPQYADNPQVAQRAAQLFKTLGLPPPLTPDGKLDPTALGANKKKDYNQLSPDDQIKFAEMPTQQRASILRNYTNVPASVLTDPQSMSQATSRAEMSNTRALLTSPNVADVSKAYAIMMQTVKSGAANPDDLAQFSTDMQNRWQQTFDMRKQIIGETKIKDSDLNAWHKASIALDQAKLEATKENNTGKLQLAQQAIDVSKQRLTLEAQKAASYVSVNDARTKMMVQTMQTKNSPVSILQTTYKGLLAQKTALEKMETTLSQTLANASSEADTDQAKQQMDALKAQEQVVDMGLQSYGAAVDSANNKNMRQQMGKDVKTVGGAGSVAPPTDGPTPDGMTLVGHANGKPVYQDAQGNYH